ncbi:MAG TPA: hypothetical protein VGS41_01285, partial [Chthonomonadales bacterium]|nr:hypothetical protein [Chthonomonadales bacterium]
MMELCCLAALLAGTAATLAGEPASQSPVAAGAKLEKLAGGFLFTEGPACDAHGNIFFTDQPNDRIMEWSAAGALTTYKQPCG